jgi:hypothetical protein
LHKALGTVSGEMPGASAPISRVQTPCFDKVTTREQRMKQLGDWSAGMETLDVVYNPTYRCMEAHIGSPDFSKYQPHEAPGFQEFSDVYYQPKFKRHIGGSVRFDRQSFHSPDMMYAFRRPADRGPPPQFVAPRNIGRSLDFVRRGTPSAQLRQATRAQRQKSGYLNDNPETLTSKMAPLRVSYSAVDLNDAHLVPFGKAPERVIAPLSTSAVLQIERAARENNSEIAGDPLKAFNFTKRPLSRGPSFGTTTGRSARAVGSRLR